MAFGRRWQQHQVQQGQPQQWGNSKALQQNRKASQARANNPLIPLPGYQNRWQNRLAQIKMGNSNASPFPLNPPQQDPTGGSQGPSQNNPSSQNSQGGPPGSSLQQQQQQTPSQAGQLQAGQPQAGQPQPWYPQARQHRPRVPTLPLAPEQQAFRDGARRLAMMKHPGLFGIHPQNGASSQRGLFAGGPGLLLKSPFRR